MKIVFQIPFEIVVFCIFLLMCIHEWLIKWYKLFVGGILQGKVESAKQIQMNIEDDINSCHLIINIEWMNCEKKIIWIIENVCI
jgi:hypothetical protein